MRKLLALLGICTLGFMLPAQAAPPTNGGDLFNLTAKANGVNFYAPYDRTISPGVGWIDGDRLGYVCAWTHLMVDGQRVAQVGFRRLPQASYVVINDAGMVERAHGSQDTGGNTVIYGWGGQINPAYPPKQGPPKETLCPNDGSGNPLSYEPNPGPIGPLPEIVFSRASGGVLETRSYALAAAHQTGSGPAWRFEIVSASPSNVTVIGYQNGQPELAIYYQPISPSVVMTSNGVA